MGLRVFEFAVFSFMGDVRFQLEVLGFGGFRVLRVLGFWGCKALGLRGSGFRAQGFRALAFRFGFGWGAKGVLRFPSSSSFFRLFFCFVSFFGSVGGGGGGGRCQGCFGWRVGLMGGP